MVGNGTVRPQESKLLAIKAFARPQTKREVRVFLALTGYYCNRRFIEGYSSLAASLTDLTRKQSPHMVNWTEECESALLQTDASNQGVNWSSFDPVL